jgi:hypothetical protein
VIDEITWHNNEAANHLDAAANEAAWDPEYADDEGWMHKAEAAHHDKAAERLRAILNAPAPEAAS